MIKYALKCAQGHEFDSWFQSAAAYDKLTSAGMLACTVCGGTEVKKTIMAPRVQAARNAGPAVGPVAAQVQETESSRPGPLSQPANPAEQAMVALREKIEQSSDYVGMNFAAEARAMHAGETPTRSIYGEARADEAKQLIEDGVPVAPLPFVPGRKTN